MWDRVSGLSLRQIADERGFSISKAHDLINEGMVAYVLPAAEEMLKVAQQRLDAAIYGLMPKIVAGDDLAIQTMLRVMEREARYFGLDKPIEHKTEYSGRLDGKQEVAVSGKVDHGGVVTIEFVKPAPMIEDATVIEEIPPEKKNGHGSG